MRTHLTTDHETRFDLALTTDKEYGVTTDVITTFACNHGPKQEVYLYGAKDSGNRNEYTSMCTLQRLSFLDPSSFHKDVLR